MASVPKFNFRTNERNTNMKKIITALYLMFMTTTFIFGVNSNAAETWKVVPSREVCMVTNMHFARPQIPVEQAGKIYYGCCENCKATIQSDASSRTATDPLSKKLVDKANAVIAANESGSVLYFENRANFKRYTASAASKKK